MIAVAILFLLAGLGLAYAAVELRSIAAGLGAAGALFIAREAAWLAFAIWRDRRDIERLRRD